MTLVSRSCYINRVILITISSFLRFNVLYLAMWWDCRSEIVSTCSVWPARSKYRHCPVAGAVETTHYLKAPLLSYIDLFVPLRLSQSLIGNEVVKEGSQSEMMITTLFQTFWLTFITVLIASCNLSLDINLNKSWWSWIFMTSQPWKQWLYFHYRCHSRGMFCQWK